MKREGGYGGFSCFVTFELFVSFLLLLFTFQEGGAMGFISLFVTFFIIWKYFVTLVHLVYSLGFLPTYTYYFGPMAMDGVMARPKKSTVKPRCGASR